MAKQTHELLPHQYVDTLSLKEPMTSCNSGTTVRQFNPAWRILCAASYVLQGKVPHNWSYHSSDDVFKGQCINKAEELRVEHAKAVYMAKRADVKIKGNVLRAIPDLDELAKVHNWESLPVEEIKNGRVKPKEIKSIPTREDPQDKFEEEFSREDKPETW